MQISSTTVHRADTPNPVAAVPDDTGGRPVDISILPCSPVSTLDSSRTVGQATAAPPCQPIRALLHDLRQPLAGLILLAESTGSDPDLRLAKIAEQARWLAALVDAVVDPLNNEDQQLVDLVEAARRAVEIAATWATCELRLDASAPTLIAARPQALVRAIACVLENAVRAAGDAGRVELRVDQMDGCPRLTITDTGPGLGRLVARTSLGLVTARAVLADLGADLDLRNGPQVGAVATMTFACASIRAAS
jgi:K+-sensing histidine kinase KdpD